MTSSQPSPVSDTSFQALTELFQAQKQAFLEVPFPDCHYREAKLAQLHAQLQACKTQLAAAIANDFGCRSVDESLLADIMPSLMSIEYCQKNLRCWMQSQRRQVSILFQPATAKLIYQPKGVVGIMAPWNYPVFLALGPLAAAIAAGNRVMIKPSEFCPNTNQVLGQILAQVFSQDEVCLVEGDVQLAAEFSRLAFDHLLFTGSTQVGKKIMAAAAQNLTPVTLELGGKSPALIAPDVDADFAVERLLYGKCLNAGQTCVAPDYILCPESKLDELVASIKNRFSRLYPDLDSGQYSAIINDVQHQRLLSWLEDAVQKGATVISTATSSAQHPRVMPLQLLLNTDDSMTVMQEELFGPLLPIITYQNTDQAMRYIQTRPRPLALYLFTFDQKLQQRVLSHTHAGGVCINDTMSHVAQEDLPFGGIGSSGMGMYHGKEGFQTFSHAKPVFRRGRFNSMKLIFPPYGRLIHKLIYRWFI